ncbi:hypothetical protein [Tepidibacillus marianensis]|uniref:hypothetical protein n=1 Tax=Tepidibacillus marianensis TaxID=3131995 RepID=UPI0030CE0F5A
MKSGFIPHSSYQDFVITQLQQHYSGGILVLTHRDWPLITELWITDLSANTMSLMDYYDAKGPMPRDLASPSVARP